MSEDRPVKKRILIAEDDVVSRRVLEVFLSRWGYSVTAVTNGTDALRVLSEEHAPRLAVLDWMMPGLEGVEVCAKVRERKDVAYTYLLLLSSRNEKKDTLAGLQAGADDYLTKPFDAEELQERLFVGERILNLQDELIAARDALQFQATHDTLTGIANRGEILNATSRELARARREHTTLGIVMADIDHFKQVNDRYGHQTGDAILCGVALRLSSLIRTYDTVGRYGGEEFLILAPASDATGIVRLAERLRAGMEGSSFETSAGTLRLTLSLGAVVSNVDSSLDCQALLHVADAALYRAKANGRNRAEMATGEDSSAAVAGTNLVHASREG